MAETFSLQRVLEEFRSSLSQQKEVYIQHYIAGWQELVCFMNSLGTVFSFISKDVVSKIEILKRLRSGEEGAHYATVQAMVSFELEAERVDLTKRGEHAESGCRTLLRLHRALLWLQLFLERLRTSGPDAKTSVLCSDAYSESLAQHHPWLVRQAVSVAFCALPPRDTFFSNMNAGDHEQTLALLGESLPLIAEVHRVTEELYAQHDLLQLP